VGVLDSIGEVPVGGPVRESPRRSGRVGRMVGARVIRGAGRSLG
jgi:hypothetical protein